MTRPRLTAAQTLTAGFAAIILLGGLLLALPISSRGGHSLPLLDALFTATSATCVTGLVVCDTYAQFTLFGQAVLLCLMQIGGLGFMTLALFFPLALGWRIGLRERSFLMEAVSSPQLGGVVRLVKLTLLGTLVLESCGAVLLALRFVPAFGLAEGLWFSVFHAVSAFCNAGFDLMGRLSPYSSLTAFAGDPLVVCTVAGLIAVGGVGFIVWDDVLRNGLRPRLWSFHTRVVALTTAALILGATLLFLLSERDTVLAGQPFGQRLLRAFFAAVSPRTAGFNTVELTDLSESGAMLTVVLMLVGAGPGSTAGGVKVTTAAVLAATVLSHMRGSADTNLLRRRVAPEAVKKALCSVTLYLFLALAGVFVITLLQNLPIKDVLFECFSAIGTVGLSAGLTRSLLPVSRVVLMLLMFAGRVGSLTVFMTMTGRECEGRLRNPVEKIVVG